MVLRVLAGHPLLVVDRRTGMVLASAADEEEGARLVLRLPRAEVVSRKVRAQRNAAEAREREFRRLLSERVGEAA